MKNELTEAEVTGIKSRITDLLTRYAATTASVARGLVDITENSLQGKLYEAWVIATVCEALSTREGLRIELIGGSKLTFKQKGGPINRNFPYFKVFRGTQLIGELFTDTYFYTMSREKKGSYGSHDHGDYHELDIALIRPEISGIPKYDEVLLAIECKNTSIKKSIIREVLGFRRELSYLYEIRGATAFRHWPADKVYAQPGSVHMLYCTDPNVLRFKENCFIFGTLLEHLQLP